MPTRSKAAASIEHIRIAAPTLDDHLAVLARAVFQAGLSWAAIDRQWDRLADAFDGFRVRAVARYADPEVRRIGATPRIVHSERKTRAVIAHAQELLDIERRFGSVRDFLRSHSDYASLVADIRRRFPYVGEVSAYYYLYRVGEAVPPFARWIRTVQGDHPRIRDMVGRTRTARPKKVGADVRKRRRRTS